MGSGSSGHNTNTNRRRIKNVRIWETFNRFLGVSRDQIIRNYAQSIPMISQTSRTPKPPPKKQSICLVLWGVGWRGEKNKKEPQSVNMAPTPPPDTKFERPAGCTTTSCKLYAFTHTYILQPISDDGTMSVGWEPLMKPNGGQLSHTLKNKPTSKLVKWPTNSLTDHAIPAQYSNEQQARKQNTKQSANAFRQGVYTNTQGEQSAHLCRLCTDMVVSSK